MSEPFHPISYRTRFQALDGIRAIAITLVFMEHYGGGSHGGVLLRAFNQIRLRGWLGVDVFFVLSGFLITGILYDTMGDSHFLQRFYGRRSLRILPVYYGVFLLLLFLTPLLQYEWHMQHLWFLVFLGNYAGGFNDLMYHLFSRNHLPWSANFGHFWTLCVEEQFYFVWPLVVLAVKDRRRLVVVASMLSVAALACRVAFLSWAGPVLGEHWMVRSLPFRADSLLIGAVLALLLRGPEADRVQRSCKALLIAAALPVLAIFVWSPGAGSPWLLTIGYTLTALASAGAIGMALRIDTVTHRLLSFKPLRILGRYSYGFYVYHLLFRYVWAGVLGRAFERFHSLAIAGLIESTSAFLVTLLLAAMSYHFYEAKILRLKRYFAYDSERSRRAAPAAAA